MFPPEAKEHVSAKRPELKGMKVLERNYVGLVMEGIRHGDAILMHIRRKRIFHHTWYFCPYLIPPDLGILKERVMTSGFSA